MFKIDELLDASKGKLLFVGRFNSIRGISTDSRTLKPDEAFIAIRGDNFDGHNFIHTALLKKASCIIIEHNRLNARTHKLVKSRCAAVIEVKDSIKALGDIANFHRNKFTIPVIAISGSGGKTTSKDMLAWLLSAQFQVLKTSGTKNNHIGLPLALLGLKKTHDFAILELGTNHFGEIKYLANICQPNLAIITNIGPAHLQYFRDLKGVFREKYSLVESLKNPAIVILNADDRFLSKKLRVKDNLRFILGFGINQRCEFMASKIKSHSGGFEFCVNNKHKFILNALGAHNIYNSLAAIASARILGMSYPVMVKRLKSFEAPESRLKAFNLNQVRFIDDTYNSNPASLKLALQTLRDFRIKGRKIFIMGDMLELGRYSGLFHYRAGIEAAKSCDYLITVGSLSTLALKGARKAGFPAKNMFSCVTARQAKEILFKDIIPRKDDIILVKGSRAMKMEEVFRS